MTPDADSAYLDLPADARLDVRLPSLLKQHAELVAGAKGESLSDLVIEALAEKVTAELVQSRTWKLTVPEQQVLLRVLAAPPKVTPAMRAATRRAARLFGDESVR